MAFDAYYNMFPELIAKRLRAQQSMAQAEPESAIPPGLVDQIPGMQASIPPGLVDQIPGMARQSAIPPGLVDQIPGQGPEMPAMVGDTGMPTAPIPAAPQPVAQAAPQAAPQGVGLPRATGRAPAAPSEGAGASVTATVPDTPAEDGLTGAYKRSGELRRQAYDALTPTEEQLDPFRRAGNYGQMAGMIMQGLGGSQIAPVGQHVLKQAMALQEKGNVDPMKQAALKAKALEAQADDIDRQAQYARTLAEKERANRASEDLRREAVETRRMLSGQAAATREEASRRHADAEKARMEDRMVKEYDARSKSFGEGLDQARNAIQLRDRALAGDPAAQVALVFAFGKMIDPGSVVRESEYKLFAEARGWFEGLQMTPERIRSGARLAPAQVENMVGIADRIVGSAEERKKALQDYMAGKAKRRDLDIRNILYDYQEPLGAPEGAVRPRGASAPAPTAPAGGPPQGAVREKR